jgi:hypothetical protein
LSHSLAKNATALMAGHSYFGLGITGICKIGDDVRSGRRVPLGRFKLVRINKFVEDIRLESKWMFMKSIMYNNSFISLCLLLVSISSAYSQDCILLKTSDKNFSFNSKTVSQIYQHIRLDTTSDYHILLLTFSGEVNLVTGVNINGGHSKFCIENFKNEEIIDKSWIKEGRKLDTLLNDLIPFSGYYMGECKNVDDNHQREVMIISNNKSGIWIEITTFNGSLTDILSSETAPKKFLGVFNFAQKLSNTFSTKKKR